MSLLDRIRKFFGGGPRSWTHPDDVECPSRYRPLLRECYWEVAAKLERIGVDRKHKVIKFTVRKGEVPRPAGWAVPHKGSPTGYAGGYATDKMITLISNPATGKVVRSSMCHEWAEAILQAKKKYKMMTTDQRHAVIAGARI